MSRVSRKERINDLRNWRNEHLCLNYNKRKPLDDPVYLESMFALQICDYLIEEIRNAPKSTTAVQVVREYRDAMDKVLCESPDDHFVTHRYARTMERLAWEILRRWQKEESPPW